jgi:thiol-disulfide isomerase/thioredoxin
MRILATGSFLREINMIMRRIIAAGLVLGVLGCSNVTSRTSGDANPAKDPVRASAAYKQGVDAGNAGDIDEAIRLFDEAISYNPDNRKYIVDFGKLTQYRARELVDPKAKYALYRRSAEVVRKLKDNGTKPKPGEKTLLGVAIYNEARADVFDNKPERAFALVNEAIESGFDELETLTTDPSLDNLRKKPEFASLITKIPELRLRDFQSFSFGFELPDLDGRTVKLTDYRGKVTIVDIWGTWCTPCRMEIPHFVKLLDKYKDKGFAVVGINYERVSKEKIRSTIEAFMIEQKMNYPCVLGDDATQDQIPDFHGFPTALFIDRRGYVRYLHTGYLPLADIEGLVKMLLDEKR